MEVARVVTANSGGVGVGGTMNLLTFCGGIEAGGLVEVCGAGSFSDEV